MVRFATQNLFICFICSASLFSSAQPKLKELMRDTLSDKGGSIVFVHSYNVASKHDRPLQNTVCSFITTFRGNTRRFAVGMLKTIGTMAVVGLAIRTLTSGVMSCSLSFSAHSNKNIVQTLYSLKESGVLVYRVCMVQYIYIYIFFFVFWI